MSDYLDEAEKWLPAELFTDDDEDSVMDTYGVLNSSSSGCRFSPDIAGNYFNSFSGFTSPVKTQNDKDDLLAILLCAYQKKKNKESSLLLPVSPSSTLSPAEIWSNGLFGPPPSAKGFVGNDDVWSLNQQGKMVEKNNTGRGSCCGGSPFLGPQRSFTSPPPPPPPPPPNTSFLHSHLLKQEDDYSWKVWNGSGYRVDGFNALPMHVGGGGESGLNMGVGYGFGFGYGFGSDNGTRCGLKSGARVGTGVFLPREYGTQKVSPPREKLDGSSTRRPSKGILGPGNNTPSCIPPSGSTQLRFGGDNDVFLAGKAAKLALQKSHSA